MNVEDTDNWDKKKCLEFLNKYCEMTLEQKAHLDKWDIDSLRGFARGTVRNFIR